VDEYNLEAKILAARIRGDADRLAKLEREKAIREEMKKLESAGFTAAEARTPAERKVDADKMAADAEAKRQAAIDERRTAQEVLAGKVNGTRETMDSLQFQSSIGAVSSMQRIGGGGGAVSSGLDYARQQSDLLRELNTSMRQLIDVSRQPIDY
jgi:membrane protein involved in colicin uptake